MSAQANEANTTQVDIVGLQVLLQLESLARKAETLDELYFQTVNETKHLIQFRQAYLLIPKSLGSKKLEVKRASSVSVIDRTSPLISWLEDTARDYFKNKNIESIQFIDKAAIGTSYVEDWDNYSLPFVMWCPLNLPDGRCLGGIWFAKEVPWKDNETLLIKRLTDTYAHAIKALVGIKRLSKRISIWKVLAYSVLTLFILSLILPVHLSTLAPVEVTAKEPTIISSPIDGVIKEIKQDPNSFIKEGEVIFRFEDTTLRNRFEVAEQALEVSQAEFHRASQSSFQDRKSKSDLALLKAQLKLKQVERDYTKELLDQVDVYAEKSGLLIYTEKADWIGRPVVVGERIMQIADPNEIQLTIQLPVEDAIVLREDAEVTVFLDVDPLNPIEATLLHASYQAEVNPEKILAYRVLASFDNEEENIRIGLQGTAKIYGEKVSLFFYLFRRPISVLRQFLGI